MKRIILLLTLLIFLIHPIPLRTTTFEPESIKPELIDIFKIMSQTNLPAEDASMVYYTAKEHGVDPILAIAFMQVESAFRSDITSSAGAYGYFQIMPLAEKCVNQKMNKTYNRFIVKDNISIGIQFFKIILTRFNGNYEKAIRYYNGGNNYENISHTSVYHAMINQSFHRYKKIILLI